MKAEDAEEGEDDGEDGGGRVGGEDGVGDGFGDVGRTDTHRGWMSRMSWIILMKGLMVEER